MEALMPQYASHLEQIKAALLDSEILQQYLESETEDLYKMMVDGFEPHIMDLYIAVANMHPLQLQSFEEKLLDPDFEGLFLPKILGYAVLRNEIDENYKYKRPHDHFRNILLTIGESANFDLIKQRIGQTVQVGFALSSDIWLTNLMEQLTNKKVKTFLNAQKLDKYRELHHRAALYESYKKQFQRQNYLSAEFPTNLSEFKILGDSLVNFLEYRSHKNFDNSSLIPPIEKLINNATLQADPDFLKVMMLAAMFYDIPKKTQENIKSIFDTFRKKDPEFNDHFFKQLLHLYKADVEITPEVDKRMSQMISKDINDSVSGYYKLMDIIHTKGYVHEDTIKAVKTYYDHHKGLSIENECLREAIFGYCESFLDNLDPESYQEYFEINKVFVSYINTFYNQKFNQNIKHLSLDYINKLLAIYTDKRGRDYQDIKKFVTSTFLDLGFKTEKEIAEMFKTKREPVKKATRR